MCDNLRVEQLEADLRYWRQKAIDLENSLELTNWSAHRTIHYSERSSRSFDDALSALDEERAG